MPWTEFCELIEPHYPKAGNGRSPVGVERMLRMYFVANWFNLADEACEGAIYDVAVFREFCRIDLGRELVELNFGDWGMRSWENIGRAYLDQWAADPLVFILPGGESIDALRIRVTDFLGDLANRGLTSAVLVTHAGVMKVCAAELLELAPAKWFSMQFEFGTVSLIDDPNGIHELIWHNRRS